jgi:hypothetical protein
MFMRYRGGGVGHSSTREATNKFLHDRDRLDVPNGHEGVEDDVEDEISGLDDEHRYQGGSREEDERRPQDAGDVAVKMTWTMRVIFQVGTKPMAPQGMGMGLVVTKRMITATRTV